MGSTNNRENITIYFRTFRSNFVYILNRNWQWLEKWTRKTTSSWFYIWRKVFSCCRWFLLFFRSDVWSIWSFGNSTSAEPLVCSLQFMQKIQKSKRCRCVQCSERWNMWSPLLRAVLNSNMCSQTKHGNEHFECSMSWVDVEKEGKPSSIDFFKWICFSWNKICFFLFTFVDIQCVVQHYGSITIAMKPFMWCVRIFCNLCLLKNMYWAVCSRGWFFWNRFICKEFHKMRDTCSLLCKFLIEFPTTKILQTSWLWYFATTNLITNYSKKTWKRPDTRPHRFGEEKTPVFFVLWFNLHVFSIRTNSLNIYQFLAFTGTNKYKPCAD